mmetsp:Transcript_32928/g.81851  ORF Transcript_32928/g.81851 Transcript_32928/m.81851 type:complete len:555 (-) Transcript_32928:236-1900(-)
MSRLPVLSGGRAGNPFAMPTDEDLFALRDEEKRTKAEERTARMSQKIWEKGMGGRARLSFKQLMGSDGSEAVDEGDGGVSHFGALSLVAAATRERRPEKEKLADLIGKKREMFLVQMALDTKRLEIRKLEERAQQREEALAKSESMLEEDVNRFDAFLKQNDTDAVEAMKKAETQTKLKADKVHEIKKLNSAITSIRSEMSKFEEQLDDCRRYRAFLDRLTPAEWVVQQKEAKAERRRARRTAERARLERLALDEAAALEAALAQEEARVAEEGRGGGALRGKARGRVAEAEEAARLVAAEERRARVRPREVLDAEVLVEDTDEELPMYFAEPLQLLQIFASLEESNLFLIQNSQETEEALDELKHKFATTKAGKEEETRALRGQIESLRRGIRNEEEKARALTERASKSTGVIAQEDTLGELDKKVGEVYHKVFGELDPNLSMLQMLTAVENKLEELLALVLGMPPDEVEAAEKAREKERRSRVREEKLEVARKQQEDRIQRSLRRAQEPVKKRVGKPVMARSAPLHRRKRTEEDDSNKLNEEDDVLFYLGLS